MFQIAAVQQPPGTCPRLPTCDQGQAHGRRDQDLAAEWLVDGPPPPLRKNDLARGRVKSEREVVPV